MQNEYLIDRHRVIFDSGVGWRCVCAEFAAHQDCKHTRESAGRLAAQQRIRTRPRQAPGLLVAFSNRAEPENS